MTNSSGLTEEEVKELISKAIRPLKKRIEELEKCDQTNAGKVIRSNKINPYDLQSVHRQRIDHKAPKSL